MIHLCKFVLMLKVNKETAISYLRERDPMFDVIVQLYGMPQDIFRPPGFESLVKIILEQQVSLMSAHATYKRLKSAIPRFMPSDVLSLDYEALRQLSVSRQKSTYLHALAQALLDRTLDLELLKTLPPEEAQKSLTRVKGIGRWTAQVYLIFCLGAPDLFPQGDIALINTIKELKGCDRPDILSLTSSWSPYRSLAAIMLWHYYLTKRGRKMII